MKIIHADLKSVRLICPYFFASSFECNRNLQPNVLISETREPLLADFGLSRVLASSLAGLTTSTTLASPKGTVRWMAVELFLPSEANPEPISTFETDIWAFGMVVYVGETRNYE